jgi:hypothetical protein
VFEIKRKGNSLIVNNEWFIYTIPTKHMLIQVASYKLELLKQIIEVIELFEQDEDIISWIDGKIERREK